MANNARFSSKSKKLRPRGSYETLTYGRKSCVFLEMIPMGMVGVQANSRPSVGNVFPTSAPLPDLS